MAEITLNRPNWLGSEVGKVVKTATILKSANESKAVTENGRKIVKAGTLIEDEKLGKGLLYNDADITDKDAVKSLMIRGSYINDKLPTKLEENDITALADKGLYEIAYADTTIAYGKVEEE